MAKTNGTISINLQKIIWDPKVIRKILEAQKEPEVINHLNKYANLIYSDAKPKLPRNTKDKRYSKYQRLEDSLTIFPTRIKRKKMKHYGEQEVPQVQIKPKKRAKYYFVVMSGKNTYNGQKKDLKYSYSGATAFPVENAWKKHKQSFNNESIKLIYNIISKVK